MDISRCLEELGHELVWCALPYPSSLPRLALPIRIACLALYTPVRWLYGILRVLLARLSGPIDYIFVPFPSHLDILPAWFLSRLMKANLVADVFLSIFNTMVEDRQIFQPSGLAAKLLRHTEHSLLRLPDRALVDTEEHKTLVKQIFDNNISDVHVVPIGLDESVFTYEPPRLSNKVIFWGTYIKLHGVDRIIRAAAIIRKLDSRISFELIGRGQELPEMKRLACELSAANVSFIDEFVPIETIIGRARSAYCALGIFGASVKSSSVVPYKVVQALALGVPVVTADSPAMRDLLKNKEDAVLVSRDREQDLVEALLWLHSERDAQLRLSRNGRRVFQTRFSRESVRSAVGIAFFDRST